MERGGVAIDALAAPLSLTPNILLLKVTTLSVLPLIKIT